MLITLKLVLDSPYKIEKMPLPHCTLAFSFQLEIFQIINLKYNSIGSDCLPLIRAVKQTYSF